MDAGSRDELCVGIFQCDLGGRAPAERMDALEPALAGAAAEGADILVTPEMFLSGYRFGPQLAPLAEAEDGPSLGRARELCRRHGIALAFCYTERAGDRLYNSALVIDAAGGTLARHRKRALTVGDERRHFDTGSSCCTFHLAGWSLGLVICYEIEFPEAVRELALAGVELMLAPTALHERWMVVAEGIVPARAFENGFFVAYANHAGREDDVVYAGSSRIVDPWGVSLALAGREPCLLTARLDRRTMAEARTRLPYLVDRAVFAPPAGTPRAGD